MAILTEKVNLHDGDNVNAELINDTVETALESYKMSADASAQSDMALKKSVEMERDFADNKMKITAMKSIVDDVQRKAELGEFNGKDAVLVPADGMFGFKIVDGELILAYTGEQKPDVSINKKGELVFRY